jgi:hypothetical protein
MRKMSEKDLMKEMPNSSIIRVKFPVNRETECIVVLRRRFLSHHNPICSRQVGSNLDESRRKVIKKVGFRRRLDLFSMLIFRAQMNKELL